MESKKQYQWVIGILIVAVLVLASLYDGARTENRQLKAEKANLTVVMYNFIDALEDANDNIDDANSMMMDAQGYAWSSYEDMGYALESLYEVNNVDAP